MLKTIVSWVLALFIGAVFVIFSFPKFTGAPESLHIFQSIESTLVQWGLPYAAQFDPIMRFGVGGAELVAALLLVIPATRVFGAVLTFALMSGAIFFHAFTELGIGVTMPGAQAPDYTLFTLAVLIWLSSIVLIVIGRGGK